MNLSKYKESLQEPLRPRTVTFIQKDNQVLLVHKLRGFGKGNYLGVGGKVEEDKDRHHEDEDDLAIAKNAAVREIFEEIDVEIEPGDLVLSAVLRFYFPHIVDESWNQVVYAFTTHKWQGVARAKEDQSGQVEVEPEWFRESDIPFEMMWDDARYWLYETLQGKELHGEFVFDEQLKVVDHTVLHKK